MSNQDLTTIQISVPARDQLRELAEFYRRSSSGQADWIIGEAYQRMMEERSKYTFSPLSPTPTQPTQAA